MKKRIFFKLFAASALFMVVCLISIGTSTGVLAQEEKKDDNSARRISREAQVALVEAQRRFETNPDDLAAARQPLVDFLAAPPEAMPGEPNPVPLVMYQMLGQYWYNDQEAKNSLEEARKVFEAGHKAYPEDEMLLYNYAATTFALERFLDAAPLFEKYYDMSYKHEIKHLYNAGAAYYTGEDLKNAKRVFVRMVGLVEIPETGWLDLIIAICQEQEDQKEADKYIKLALSFYPLEKKYWNYLAGSFLSKEDYKGATSALEIATRVKEPERGNEWRQLIDLYNYIGLPLRTAASIQEGYKLLEKSYKKNDPDILIADAYAKGARVDKAVSYLDGILSKERSFELLMKKGKILLDARRNKEAIAVMDECIAMNAKAWDAYYIKGLAAWDLEEWETAKKAFDMATSSKDYSYQSQQALDMLSSLDKAKSE